MWLLMLSLFCCKTDHVDKKEKGDTGDTSASTEMTDTLTELYDADRADRITSQLGCTDVQIGIQRQLEGKAPMSEFLPRSVLLAMAEPGDLERSTAAQTYFMTVIDLTWRARVDEAMSLHRDGMTRDEFRDILGRIWVEDTYVSLSDMSPAMSTFCGVANRRSGGAPLGPTDYGFVCPLSPTPDCAADPPTEPWGCPPKGVEDCPDCPGLEDAKDDLDKLEELFEAAQGDEILGNILDALVDALLDAIESGDPPTPADLVLPVITAVLGPGNPGIAFYVDVLASTVQGGMAGGPVGGAAAMAWAIITGWGDFVDASERLGDIDAARDRLRRLKEWCEKFDWANKQAECKLREQRLFEDRTAECIEANATYDAAYAAWEIDQEDCDQERADVAAANASASSRTALLQGSQYAFTAEAFEECCEIPFPDGPRCPELGSPIDPTPIPPWAKRRPFWMMAIDQNGVKKTGGGNVGPDLPFADGFPSQPTSIFHWPSHPEILVGADGAIYDIAGGGDMSGAVPWATFPPPSLITGIAWDHHTRQYIVTDLLGGVVYRIDGPGDYELADAHATGLSFPVDTLVHDDGRLLAAVNGAGGLIDVTAGGDQSGANLALDTAPYYPQHFVRMYDGAGTRFILSGSDAYGDGAFFDVDIGASPIATGIFNPAGMATDYNTGQTLAASFSANGELYDVTDMTQGTDFSADAPHTFGMSYPEGITWAPIEE